MTKAEQKKKGRPSQVFTLIAFLAAVSLAYVAGDNPAGSGENNSGGPTGGGNTFIIVYNGNGNTTVTPAVQCPQREESCTQRQAQFTLSA